MTADRFMKWMAAKNFLSVRSGMLYVSVWMTFDATHWATRFAESLHFQSGTDTALVIAAATAPITAFTGFVYKFYSDSRAVVPIPQVLAPIPAQVQDPAAGVQ
jgi:hypothetical protein